MLIVDSHCHVSTLWYEPVETLNFQMERNKVEKAVLVQYMGQFKNDYLFECKERWPGRFAIVPLVDWNREDAIETLTQLASKSIAGIRLRPDSRSPGADPLAIWKTAEELGLSVSCSGEISSFANEDFINVVESVPNLPIVLEHLGAENYPDGFEAQIIMWEKVLNLSRFGNVHIKVHGIGEFCKRIYPPDNSFPFPKSYTHILDRVFEAFGAEKIMWGSDFPPVCSREGYHNSLKFILDYFRMSSGKKMDLIFSQNAEQIFFNKK